MDKTVRIACKGCETKELSELENFQDDLKKLTRNNAVKLRNEILELGFSEPVSVWLNEGRHYILNGHQRVAVLKDLREEGYEVPPLPVSLVEASSYQEAKKKVLALTSQYGQITEDGLQRFLKDARISLDDALESFRFPEIDLEKLAGGFPARQDEVPELPAEAVTTPGELIELGGHRLLCGDATDPAQVRRLMDGKRAVLFATDPPYLVGYDGTNHPGKWNESDKNKDWSETYGVHWDEADANPDLYDKFVAVAKAEVILENAAWYCWHASRNQIMVEDVWNRHGAFVHQQIIWAKDRPILTRSWYCWRHEPCFFGWVKGKKPPRRSSDYPHSVWELPTLR